ncbi:unnamed protein product [Staurois parvus]|uniref:Secreted protein n=1 Tax=Staurois parvus TaxID=386267 RepID=A0ABN9B4L2_9NEOB|nr:unnamed protein product [Staurois parvus]
MFLSYIWIFVAHRAACAMCVYMQGRTDHLETQPLPEGPEVSRGPHEMPLVPFFIGFFEFGQGHRAP